MDTSPSRKPERAPFVSVVVPVFNAPDRVATCTEALLAQTYPDEDYEIIIVDNASTDNTRDVIQRYPVSLLVEDEVQSPYAARNRGIRAARGEIIALIDANCTPIAEWLAEGVRAIQSEHADLAGGKVTFTFPGGQTPAELYDSITHVDMRRSIETRGAALGGNLFVKRQVFESVGLFPSRMRSGGDILWTSQATQAGLKLVYADHAQATYPARKLFPLLKKQIRVGRGQVAIWRARSLPGRVWLFRIVKGFLPPSPGMVRGRLREQGMPCRWPKCLLVWLDGWLCKLATSVGRLQALVQSRDSEA
jgi:glycosyltransferase involved in cell wall biosynthesis